MHNNLGIRRVIAETMAVGAALMLAGCSATGTTTAAVTSASGVPVGTAQFSYSTHGGSSAQLVAMLPGDERFEGEAVSRHIRSDPGVGFVVGAKARDAAMVIPTSGKTWTGEIDAILTSSEGLVMECSLREKRAGLGLEGGASGTCTVSDGRRLVARF